MTLPAVCPVCGSNRSISTVIRAMPPGAQFFTRSRNQYRTQDNTLNQCLQCDHIFFDIEPVSYYQQVIRSVSISPSMMSMRESQFNSFKYTYFAQTSNPKILEIGAGSGAYSSLLKRTFGHCISTEASDQSETFGAFNPVFIHTHPDHLNFVEKLTPYYPFDGIFCFSYLEHLPNPLQTLQKASTLLSENGILCIEVPDTSFIQNECLVNELIPDHLHYFTPFSLNALARRSGLEIVRLESIWNGYILSAVMKKKISHNIESLSLAQNTFNTAICTLLDDHKDSHTVAMWGAGHQSLFATTYTRLSDTLSYIVDSSPQKQAHYTPVNNIPIYPPEHLLVQPPELLIISCAGYNPEVIATVKDMHLKSTIVTIDGNNLSYVK